jgi:hypothetical protein
MLPIIFPSFSFSVEMFRTPIVLSLLLSVVSVANATPINRDPNNLQILALSSKINAIGAKSILELDRARVTALRENALGLRNGKRTISPVSALNVAVASTVSVGVGSPPTQCEYRNRNY